MKQNESFTEGRIFSPLIRFALPVLFALFLQTMYGAVDLLIVGQFGGELADVYVSAVSTGSQLMQAITVVITGLAMGLTVFVGTEIGAGQREKAGKIIGSGIFLFGVIAVGIAAIMVCTAPLLAKVMHAPEEAFDETVSYITICSAGAVFIVAYNLVGSIFRGIGDSKMPLITVAIACVLNIAGDMLFVAVFHMGASGAAAATVFSQAVSVLISLLMIRRRKLPFDLSAKDIKPQKKFHRGNASAGYSHCLTGPACKYHFSCNNRHSKFSGTDRFGRSGSCRKALRIFNACPIGIYAVNVRLCGAEYRRREATACKKGIALRNSIFTCCERDNGILYIFPRRLACMYIRKGQGYHTCSS